MNGNQKPMQNGHSGGNGPALELALEAYRQGRLDDAQRLARTIAEASPKTEDAWSILAAVAQRQSRFADAAQIFKDAIAKNPQSLALYTMLGLFLRDTGRFEDAETALRHVLSLNAAQKDAALHLGNMFARMGRLDDAEAVFFDATTKLPEDPQFPLQMGRLMLTRGDIAKAMSAFQEAVTLGRAALSRGGDKPQDPSIYIAAAAHLGSLLMAEGERLQALDYFYDAVELGGDRTICRQFADCVSEIPFTTPQPLLKPLLTRALDEAWIAPEDLVRQCANQLMLDPEFSAPVERIDLLAPDTDTPLTGGDIRKVTDDPLLRAMLTCAIVPDPAFERLLTKLRRLLLQGAGEAAALAPFTAALAGQCFLTDFAYGMTGEEAEMVEQIAARVSAAAAADGPIAAAELAALACYRGLAALDCADALAKRQWDEPLESLVELQLRQPRKEAALRKEISCITPITDATSSAVRAQYEENPFPRWVRAPLSAQPTTLAAFVQGHVPAGSPPAIRYADPATKLDILVAGCGTGQEAIGTAIRFANSELLAVDLSLTSLAYARRKSEDIGLKNIYYAQADILELDGLGRQFDVVECAGVLHHLAEPVMGWRVLDRLTRPGGYMLIALYSRIGRNDLEPARAFITERGYGTTADELRRFRADVLALPSDDPVRKLVRTRDDFYNLSMLRDLLFHAQERSFTIPEIAAMIDMLGLEFCGFAATAETRIQFREHFGPGGNIASLADWETFENAYPDTFRAMYHFLVRKPD